ncbi:helix-turn-helix domain-containing protein [Methylophaga sp.]|uniref:helix-turn-helix domain-containing protein n=1 Tax=Methylophaga sp. TaxID=2024840 RepID=UPI002717D6CC|nr:helix-turn-helix domain-containing protein [Methylophaga sp.]MDO8828470.1 helix-turn-helix domain-containing protein [Methylophaga sp.]
MNNFSAAAVLDRLQLAAGVASDSALSRVLRVNRATLGNWRNRDSVPYSICVEYAVENGLSLDWLLTGQAPLNLNEAKGLEERQLDETQLDLLKLFTALWPDQQKQVLQGLREKKRINDLELAVTGLQQRINKLIDK